MIAWRSPYLLWLIGLVAPAAFAYLMLLRRYPRRFAVRFPTLILGEAASRVHGRRHVAAAIFGAGCTVAFGAAAGPILSLRAPTGHPVVLIIDISRSMEETDIAPSRIEAAKSAAVEFARALPRASRVALVTFGNFTAVVVPLTDNRDRVIEGIQGLTTQLRTQLGTGLMEGVRAVTGEGPLPPLAGGFRAVAVLLSDGRASDGVPPAEAARAARERGVRVYTVGLGTAADPSTLRSGYWGVLDELTLRMIADETGGRYYPADQARRLYGIYRELARIIGWERRATEVSAVAAAAALILLAVAVALRFRYVPIG